MAVNLDRDSERYEAAEDYIWHAFHIRNRVGNRDVIQVGCATDSLNQPVAWFADFKLGRNDRRMQASRHQGIVPESGVDCYRFYFYLPGTVRMRMRPSTFSYFHPCNAELLGEPGENNIVVLAGTISLSIEVGCGGTYLMWDQFGDNRVVFDTRLGGAFQRPNCHG